jgi:hypothetical protein
MKATQLPMKELSLHCGVGDNANACGGGVRMWKDAKGARPSMVSKPRPR